MVELITLLIDLGLGAYAYRLGRENRTEIAGLRARIEKLEEICGKYLQSVL